MKKVLRPFFAILVIAVLVLSQTSSPSFAQDPTQKPLWGWTTVAEYEKATGNKLPELTEAPMLAEQVKAGTLPALKDRLPKEPMVDNPFESVGKYGGSLTLGQVSAGTAFPASNFTTVEYVLSLGRDGTTVVPNIAKGWEFSEGGKVFTLFLREGMKWSDGDPFDADDFMFYWEDIANNPEINPAGPASRYTPGGEPAKWEKVDAYTIRMTFAAPYYAITTYLAGPTFVGLQGAVFEASHYLKQFHKKYNDKVDEEAKAAGFETWVQYFSAKRYFWYGQVRPEIPTMGAWRAVQVVPEGTILERNPYYFKVDTAGQQLPYIDKVTATLFNDAGTLALKMVAGEYDYQDWSTTVSDYPAFVDGQEKGNYQVFMAPSLWTNIAAYTVNQQYAGEPAIGDILRDKRFRMALSYALDRDEINQVIALGQGTPFAATAHPSASFYKEEWGKAYIEYDVAKASSLLDEMGMDKRDGENFRLRPDGQPFSLIISDVNDAVPEKMAELIKEYWDEIGIRTIVTATDRTLMGQQYNSGEYMVSGWAFDGASEAVQLIAGNPYIQGNHWAPKWFTWYNSLGKSGEEPSADVKRMFDLYRSVPTLDPEAQKKALTEVFDIWSDGLWRIGTIGMVPKPGIYRNGLKNVDTNTYTDNSDVGIGNQNRHYQFYWDK